MKRVLLVLAVTAMASAVMLSSLALSASAEHDQRPAEPDCDWYGPFSLEPWEEALPWLEEASWWEYWCYWPHWGWEFVFWTWADLPEEDRDSPPANWPWAPEDKDSPPEDENSLPEKPSWPPEGWPWSEKQ